MGGGRERRESAVVSAFTQLVVIRRQGLVLSRQLLEDRAGWREAVNGPRTHAESSDQPAPFPDLLSLPMLWASSALPQLLL